MAGLCSFICKEIQHLLSLQRNVADHHRLAGLLAPAENAASPDGGNLEVVLLGLFWHVLHVAATAGRRYHQAGCDIRL